MSLHPTIIRSFFASVMFLVICLQFAPFSLEAAPTPEQRKELIDLKKDITPIINHVKKKEFDEAEKLIKSLEEKLDKLVKDAGFAETDPAVSSTRKAIDLQLNIIAKQKGGGKVEQVSFKDDIAPILNANCISCHGNNGRGGLRLNCYANMKKGGQNGPLLVIGKPQLSNLMARISVRGPNQMPKDGDPLKREDIEKISNWIQQGAKYDGADENMPLDELIKKSKEAKLPPIVVVKATGNEKVSFSKDLAPMLVNVCGGCHNDRNKDGGLSLSTFESMLRGGDSGSVLVAGEPEKSRMYRLVMQLEQPKMPQGQALIKRSQAVTLGDWIKEGLKFDGKDSKAPLASLVPSEAEMQAQKLASMSDAEFNKLRLDQTTAQWKKAASGTPPVKVERDNFLIVGDVPEIRLNQVGDWADKTLKKMQSSFGDKATSVWRGKLAIMVFKDRFGYQEFNIAIEQRDAPRELHSHAKVTENFQDAYVALEDVGDTTNSDRADLQFNVVQQVVAAYMLAQSTKLPAWLVEGSGMYIAFQEVASKEFSITMNNQAKAAFNSLNQPQQIFRPGALSPADVAPAGMAIVSTLMNQGKPPQFKILVQEFSNGSQPDDAFKKAYNINAKSLAEQIASQIGAGR